MSYGHFITAKIILKYKVNPFSIPLHYNNLINEQLNDKYY